MNDIKAVLKVKAAEQGVRITKEDPLNILIDCIVLWIKENNKALLSDLLRKATQIDAIERRERIKQVHHLTELIGRIPLELSQDQRQVIREQVHLAMVEEVEKIKPQPWWKTPAVLLGAVNFVVNLGILFALLLLV